MISATTALADLPGFDSLAIVGLLEQIEDQLHIAIDPALIVPETFASPATIAGVLIKSQRAHEHEHEQHTVAQA